MPAVCDHCGSRNIRGMGMGTQRLETMVKKLWPRARVLRLDSDAAKGPDSYFEIWETFQRATSDILVGTQLVTRGLDLPAVTCVGVVDADLPLHFPDYRSAENTFSLVVQVADRAGRDGREARVSCRPATRALQPSLRRGRGLRRFLRRGAAGPESVLVSPFAELAVLTRTDAHDDTAPHQRVRRRIAGRRFLKERIEGIRVMARRRRSSIACVANIGGRSR